MILNIIGYIVCIINNAGELFGLYLEFRNNNITRNIADKYMDNYEKIYENNIWKLKESLKRNSLEVKEQ